MRWPAEVRFAVRCVRRASPFALALLAGCANVHQLVPDTPVRLGRPYTVRGRTYVPSDDRTYDTIGEASWYGTSEQGHPTANGERFDKRRVSAASKTLPLPSYVEVTRLDTGQRMLVRVNDRGPFVEGRVLDLSREAARQIGLEAAGHTLVRVRRVQPTRGQMDRLRRGYPVLLSRTEATASPLGTGPEPALPAPLPRVTRPLEPMTPPAPAYAPTPSYAPAPAPSPAPIPSPPSALPRRVSPTHPPIGEAPSDLATTPALPAPRGPMIVVATPNDPDAADALASALAGEGARVQATGGGFRIVTGPYLDASARDEALSRLRARGYQGAVALDAPSTQP